MGDAHTVQAVTRQTWIWFQVPPFSFEPHLSCEVFLFCKANLYSLFGGSQQTLQPLIILSAIEGLGLLPVLQEDGAWPGAFSPHSHPFPWLLVPPLLLLAPPLWLLAPPLGSLPLPFASLPLPFGSLPPLPPLVIVTAIHTIRGDIS